METALTRYFAFASWSDYGYWVISIVMAGFAASGVALALAQARLLRHSDALLAWLPVALIVLGAAGYEAVIVNPFNPLQLQNQVTYLPQLENIGLYYAALLPFFFCAGLFISLNFVANSKDLARVYAADLLGAGVGCLLVLGLLYLLSPFGLIPALLPILAGAVLCAPSHSKSATIVAVLVLTASEIALAFGPQAAISPYKPIYAPLHTPGAKVLAEIKRPSGYYMLLDDFTERVNTDISNDATMLGYGDPPRSLGLYRDGIRIASVPRPGALTSLYAPGALDALPYSLMSGPRVLLIGASGGFRISEVLALGAKHVTAVEPEAVLSAALRKGLGGVSPFSVDPRVMMTGMSPRLAVHSARYDVIDLSADFLDAAPANIYAFTSQSLAADFRALQPGGLLSIPISIQDFPAYGLRGLATVRAALAINGINSPAAHVVVYRSAWNARILVSAQPFTPAQINNIKQWCDARSFDVSFYAGMDVAAARANLYNDLPAVSFDQGVVTGGDADDSIADEAGAVLAGQPSVSQSAFDLRPMTDDRPIYYAILKLDNLALLLARLQILPQGEIGALVNLAVLAQAALIAALLLVVPLAAPKAAKTDSVLLIRNCVYFPALALGFLFVEIFAIERASLFLNDRAAAFAIVLSTMLIGSGFGSFLSARFMALPRRAVMATSLIVSLWAAFMLSLTGGAMDAVFLPDAMREGLVVLALLPVSVAMGMPFPLGLARQTQRFYLAWAWGLNGAFSVVATPLANLVLREIGLPALLGSAVLMYVLAAMSFPAGRRQQIWASNTANSAGAQPSVGRLP